MLQILQWIILAVILAAFSLIPLAGLYLASQEVRDIVKAFQRWESARRSRRESKHSRSRRISYSQKDAELTMRCYHTIYDEMVAQFDPRDTLRLKKEQDAKDQETLDKATEYTNALGN